MSLPPEARKGVERAFLELMRKRHPEYTWTIVPSAPAVSDEDVLAYTGTCQSCGRYLDVRQHDRCPSPCNGYIG